MDEEFRPGGQPPPQWGPPPGPSQYGRSPWGPPPGPSQYGPPAGPQGGPQYGAPQYGPPPGPPGYGPGPTPGIAPGYGPPPTEGLASPYGGDFLGSTAPPPRRSRGRVVWAGVATAAVVALTAGGVYAYTTLSGGGAALASKVPADAVAYAELNLDPPAGQKVAAVRFLRHFPDAKIGSESGSLLESVIEPLISDPEARKQFVEDIKPWVGKHIAVAADPQGGEVEPVGVVEATDTGEAKAGLDRFNAKQNDKDRVRYAISGDVVYVGDDQAVVDTAAKDAGNGALASNDTFTGDVEKVGGDDGIVTFWSDLGAAAKYDPRSGAATATATAQGRVAGRLTFTDTTADLVVKAFGNPAKAGSETVGPRLKTLPADTVGAAALSGGDELVRNAYEQLEKAGLGKVLTEAEEDLGIELPDGIAALVGSSTVLAVGGTEDQPDIGMVSKTSDPAAARAAADKILTKIDADSSVTVRSTADGTVLASSSDYADRLTATGTLGEQEQFKAALPDLDTAQLVVYVDVAKAATLSGEDLPASAKPIRSFGLTAATSGDTSTLHLRLVVS